MRLFGRRSTLSQIEEGLKKLGEAIDKLDSQVQFIRTRLSCYLGDGVALTYTAGETPILVNANDFGGPFNLINGGLYEQDNLDALLSFVTPDTIFLDIGANVGFFTLAIARRLGKNGRVYAFEPHPKLAELLVRNIYVNGLTGVANCFRFGLSDRNAVVSFNYPSGHLGGGHIALDAGNADQTSIDAEIRQLDDVFASDFSCDLVKIDVEGHELNVLRGMRRIVANSPNIKILFEKLALRAGSEDAIEDFFLDGGFDLYGIKPDSSLHRLGHRELADWSGYVLAARRDSIEDGLVRARFSIYPGQLYFPAIPGSSEPSPRARGANGQILFHGPYWFLQRGIWRVVLHGEVQGTVRLSIQERFGYPVSHFLLRRGQLEHVLVAARDLVHFECAAFAVGEHAELRLERLEFIRQG